MRRAPTLLPAVVLLLANPTQAEISPWFETSAPAGVFTAAGVPEPVTPAFALLTLIRVSHATPAGDEVVRIRSAIEDALAGPTADRIDLPLPLPPSTFLAILPDRTPAERLFPALIRDRRASLFYYGAMSMDPETRAFIASRPAFARELAADHASAVAAFGRSIRVAGGRLVMPGGDGAVAAWEELVGESSGDTPGFIRRLLSVRDGRTAYLFDTVAHLDPPRQRFALASLRSLHRAFADIEPEWSIAVTPFIRPVHDAALLLRLVPVDERGAARDGMWQALWDAAVASDDIPRRPQRTFRRVAEGPRIDARWLADAIALTPAPVRRRRYEQFAFGVRRFADVEAAAAPDVAVALRGFDRYPALMLALERMGVRAPAVYAAAARGAKAVSEIGGQRHRVTATTQFQGLLAILDRAARSGRLAPDAVESLLVSLCGVVPDDDGYDGRLAAWIDEALLPALGASGGSPAEAAVLAAIADRSPDADGRRIDWEGIPYVIDYGAGEIARFEQVLSKQRGNRLDAVLGLARAVRAQEAESRRVRQVRGQARLESPVRALEPLRDWAGLPGSAPPTDAPLGEIVDHALAEVLLGLAYAPHQGDPAELFAAAADLFHRHDFGAAAIGVTAAARARLPWARPRIQDAPGQQMRVTGALLGLDLALARFAVRRLTADRMPERPRLNRNDREVFMTTAALLNPRELTDADMRALAAALERGRERLVRAGTGAPALDALAVEAGMSDARRHLLPWIAARAPAGVQDAFSQTELLRLGGARAGDAWGVVDEPLTGCYCLTFPDGSTWEDLAGRPAAGHVASRVPDLTLRLAELFVGIGAPAALLPGALAYATQDFIDEAPSLHPDDWQALVRQARSLDRLRVEDYLAAVAARGPLRPAGRP